MNAEICFLHQHMSGFPDPEVVALDQVLAKSPVEHPVDEYDLHLLQQVVGSGHLVPKGNDRRPVVLASTWPRVSVSTKRLRPVTSLPASKPAVTPVAGAAFLTLCVSIITAVGPAFFGPVRGNSHSDKCLPVPTSHRLPTWQNTSKPCSKGKSRLANPATRTRF